MGQAVMVDRGTEVPEFWRADQPLYVKGELGIPRDRLDEFSGWLKKNAPNWTVVLMRDARGEAFRDASGTSYTGMDAVEHSLGKTLPARTAFADLVHPQSGENNGAYFILYLDERKVAYHASDAYDRRRLGEDHWNGNLDAAAIDAMRGGGRVLDAAKNTITSIDGELARRIRQEAAATARAAEQARRAKEETAAAITEARQRLIDLELRIATLRRDFHNPTGDLATVPLGTSSGRLDAAGRMLAEGNPEAASLTQSVAADIEGHIRALFDHQSAPARFLELQQEFDQLQLHEFSAAARASRLTGRKHLAAADAAHARADSSYRAEHSAAERNLAEAVRLDHATRTEVATLGDLEDRAEALSNPPHLQQLLENTRKKLVQGAAIQAELQEAAAAVVDEEQAQLRAIRQREMAIAALVTGAALAVAGLLFLAWRGNRRRRNPRQRAQQLFETWTAALRERSDGLFDLLDRTSKAVGSTAVLDGSGWTGETLRLSRQTLADVDHLFILACGIERVLDQARLLLFPTNVFATCLNHVSASRYERALVLLEQEAVQFSPDDPLRPILQGRETKEWQGLLGRREEEVSFTLTFIELNEAFRERAARTVAALGVLESCWVGAEEANTALDAVLTETETEERKIDAAAAQDGLFGIDPVFDRLIPAAREDQDQALKIASTDPVSALGTEFPRGSRRAAAARALCSHVARLRSEVLPALEIHARVLQENGRRTAWIGAALHSFTSRSATMAEAALGRPIDDELHILSADADALAMAATTAADLDKRAAASCTPAIDAARLRTGNERQRLGGLLKLPAEQILRENPSLDPDVALGEAAKSHAAALAQIDLGEIAAAAHALDHCDQLCASVHALIDATLQSIEDAEASIAGLQQEANRISALVPPACSVLAELESHWSPTALRPADPALPDGAPPVSGNIRLAESRLHRSRTAADEAQEKHRIGHLLLAADLRQEAAAAHVAADQLLLAIHDQARTLASAAQRNSASLAELDHAFQAVRSTVDSPQTTRPTQAEFDSSGRILESARAAVLARGPAANPFLAHELLQSAAASLENINHLLERDRALHEEVARSLDAAEGEMRTARQLAHAAQSDDITDSTQTTTCLERLAGLDRELAETKESFAIPHGDWPAMDITSDRITAQLASLVGELRGDLELAQQCVRALQAASTQVRAASSWGTRVSLGIIGSTGLQDLENARNCLSSGDYHNAHSLAASSLRKATQAIRSAEAEIQRRRRAEERQREETRRRQQQASFSSSSGSSFGSRSSFGSSSGSSSSSFSSGSGTSRSGW